MFCFESIIFVTVLFCHHSVLPLSCFVIVLSCLCFVCHCSVISRLCCYYSVTYVTVMYYIRSLLLCHCYVMSLLCYVTVLVCHGILNNIYIIVYLVNLRLGLLQPPLRRQLLGSAWSPNHPLPSFRSPRPAGRQTPIRGPTNNK